MTFFHERVGLAIKEATTYSDNNYSSVGLRINFAINSWDVIKKNPLIGVGTGDFPNEYKKINTINSPELIDGVSDASDTPSISSGELIVLIFLYSFGKSPVPTPIKGFFLITSHEFIAKLILRPTEL